MSTKYLLNCIFCNCAYLLSANFIFCDTVLLNIIPFSRPEKSGRIAVFRHALEFAQAHFANNDDLVSNTSLEVSEAAPKSRVGLQAVGYFVWALRRLFERGEERNVGYLWRSFRLVQDIDDRRETGQGMNYTKKPLNAAALKWRKENREPGISHCANRGPAITRRAAEFCP